MITNILRIFSVVKNIKDMRTVIYARVSTSTQDNQRQLDELREYATRIRLHSWYWASSPSSTRWNVV